MWTAKGEDDDWLAGDEPPKQREVTQVEVSIASTHFEVDLTSSQRMEPLHSLPEAPPCSLRM